MNYFNAGKTVLLLFIIVTFLSGCLEDRCESERTYTIWEPVFVTVDEIRKDIGTEAPIQLEDPGKIYYYQEFIFINEFRKGVHVIDNRDPENPEPVSFIRIPGNVDIAIIDNILYADNYIDLVTLDISEPTNVQFLGRTEDVFPSHSLHQDLGHLVYYEPTQETVTVDCESPNWGQPFFFFDRAGGAFNDLAVLTSAESNSGRSNQGGGPGVGGSLARFTIAQGHLYAVTEQALNVFDISTRSNPRQVNTVNLGWGIETIFPYEENLFIGSNTGMFIFDNSNPTNPTMLSVFEHAFACDPVFVNGNTAYITLRNGVPCSRAGNQLDVVDVSNLSRPRLIASYPMDNPHGLSLANDHLFICEGDFGLKVFESTDSRAIDDNLVNHFKNFATYDVITLPSINLAMVIGDDGLYQFDISDPKQIKELSIMRTVK